MFLVLNAPGSGGRAVPRPAVAYVMAATLNSKITTNLPPGDIAHETATDEADRARNDGPGHGSYGRVCNPVVRAGSRS